MSGFILIAVVNIGLFALVRWFMDSDLFKSHGEHRLSGVLILGIICFWTFAVFTGGGMMLQGATTGAARFTVGCYAVLTALPWVLPFIMVFTDGASASVVDGLFGLAREVQDEVDLRKAHELLRKGQREEAVEELNRLRREFPDSSNARFVLAALSEDTNDYEAAADYYREILLHCHQQLIPWTNAANALSQLLEEEMNDVAGANHLRKEIQLRNPDSHFKISMGDEKQVKKKSAYRAQSSKRASREPEGRLDLNQARRLIAQKEIPKGLALFKRYLDEHPGEVRGHFELAGFYERYEREDDAVRRFQLIIQRFESDDDTWAKAVLRLASIRENSDHDTDLAISLLRSVADRLRHTAQGKEARQRLKDIRQRIDG